MGGWVLKMKLMLSQLSTKLELKLKLKLSLAIVFLMGKLPFIKLLLCPYFMALDVIFDCLFDYKNLLSIKNKTLLCGWDDF